MQAFNGSHDLKNEMTERVRTLWADGRLVAGGALLWDAEKALYSINGALAQTTDAEVFEARTGIALDLALLCESVLVLNAVAVKDKSKAIGFTVVHDPALDGAVTAWLEAIRPGADLAGVIPKFMVHFLGLVLGDTFPQRDQIPPDVRHVAAQILENWRSELSGQVIEARTWRQLRSDAVKATENVQQPWAYPISHFVETLAWPLASVTKEFRQPFMFLTGNLLAYLQVPYQADEDKRLAELALKGHLTMHHMDREGRNKPEDRQAMLDADPAIKEAMSWYADDVRNARIKAAQQRAFVATTPWVQQLMDSLVQFIREA